MTKLDAMRAIVSAPRQHPCFAKIGRKQKPEYATPDGREQITPRFCVRLSQVQAAADRILRRQRA